MQFAHVVKFLQYVQNCMVGSYRHCFLSVCPSVCNPQKAVQVELTDEINVALMLMILPGGLKSNWMSRMLIGRIRIFFNWD